MNITIYNEYVHEKTEEECAKVYPEGIHAVLGKFLGENIENAKFRYFTLDNVNEELTDEILDDTDVLVWWGHKAHGEVEDEVAVRVQMHVLGGMGAVFLHSGHHSKPFKRLMGTTANLRWAEGYKEIIWVADPTHPVAEGLPEYFTLPIEEAYGEPFDIPQPDSTVFMSWYSNGLVFRSGCAFTRGKGKIFFFQPGHEMYPTYYDENVRKVVTNAVKWACPAQGLERGKIPVKHVKEPVI